MIRTISHQALSVGAAIIMAAICSSCVQRSDYDDMAQRYENAKSELEHTKQDVVKEAKKAQAVAEESDKAQAETQKLREELEESKRKFESLKAEYESFKTQRRASMVGKKYPDLVLLNGRTLKDAEIVKFDLAEVTFRHAGGITHISMNDLGNDIRWEAVWTPADAIPAEGELAQGKKQDLANLQTTEFMNSLERSAANRQNSTRRVQDLTQLVKTLTASVQSQRTSLNASFQEMMRSTSSSHLSTSRTALIWKASWSTAQPESSPLFTDSARTPAGAMGFTSLQNARNDILATLKRLSSAQQELSQATMLDSRLASSKRLEEKMGVLQVQLTRQRQQLNDTFENLCRQLPLISSKRNLWNQINPESSRIFDDPAMVSTAKFTLLITLKRDATRTLADMVAAKRELAAASK